MRAKAAIFIFTVWTFHSHALADWPFGLNKKDPILNLFSCTQSFGFQKCIYSFGIWRAERAIESLQKQNSLQSNLTRDMEQFPWNQFSNSSDEQLYSQLCDGAEKLLQHRALTTTFSDYTVLLDSKGDGKLSLDLFKKNETSTARGSKLRKRFYAILPLLMVPGLIMSAILPFILPALKMMTVGAVMLNNMALSGAIFTLLRNNAFNDRYEKKVIYVNEGYHNEKHAPSDQHEIYEPYDDQEINDLDEEIVASNREYMLVKYPMNHEWVKEFTGRDDIESTEFELRRSNKEKKKNLIQDPTLNLKKGPINDHVPNPIYNNLIRRKHSSKFSAINANQSRIGRY